jgi:hypothetical protein
LALLLHLYLIAFKVKTQLASHSGVFPDYVWVFQPFLQLLPHSFVLELEKLPLQFAPFEGLGGTLQLGSEQEDLFFLL